VAATAIPYLTNVLRIHLRICELSIADIVRKYNLKMSITIISVRDVEDLIASENEETNSIPG
jgi:hypothetical protein